RLCARREVQVKAGPRAANGRAVPARLRLARLAAAAPPLTGTDSKLAAPRTMVGDVSFFMASLPDARSVGARRPAFSGTSQSATQRDGTRLDGASRASPSVSRTRGRLDCTARTGTTQQGRSRTLNPRVQGSSPWGGTRFVMSLDRRCNQAA